MGINDIKIILVPYDNTSGSESALIEGSKLSKIFNAKMIMLFVIEDKFFSKPYLQRIFHTSSESKRKVINVIDNAVSGLMEKKVSYFGEREISTEYIVERGYPTEIILNKAKETNADLIVMGRKGLRSIKKLKALGSVSRKVAENADVPVVLVSHHTSATDKGYNKILVPYDVEDPKVSNSALYTALRIKGMNEHKVLVLHVVPEFMIPTSVSGVKLRSRITGKEISIEQYFKELYSEIKEDALRFIESIISQESKNIEIKISYGNPADRITEFVAKNNVELVIMGTNTLHGVSKIGSLGSVTRKVSESVDCPIMLVK